MDAMCPDCDRQMSHVQGGDDSLGSPGDDVRYRCDRCGREASPSDVERGLEPRHRHE